MSSMMPKKIVLVGSTGTGKGDLALQLAAKFHLDIQQGLPPFEVDPAIGELADYRMEVFLAVARVMNQSQPSWHTVYTHTLVDSMAYPGVRLQTLLNSDLLTPDDELRWNLTLHTNALMAHDSFASDQVLFLPGNDGTDFSRRLEEALKIVLEEMNTKYVVLDPSLPHIEQAATIVEELLSEGDGSRSSDSDTDGED